MCACVLEQLERAAIARGQLTLGGCRVRPAQTAAASSTGTTSGGQQIEQGQTFRAIAHGGSSAPSRIPEMSAAHRCGRAHWFVAFGRSCGTGERRGPWRLFLGSTGPPGYGS